MDPHYQRALILFEQSRPDLAENELRQALLADPNHALAHALLALCMVERDEFEPATREAEAAIHLTPDLPFAHYALASIMRRRNRLPEADAAIGEALRLDPENPDYHAARAGIRIGQERWADALASADAGLRQDAEHMQCNNMRAVALVKLGRKQEAGQTIAATLARDPENAASHANMGWTCLEQNDPQQALEHFREALRLDPELDWARSGMVEALKARHFLYRLFLRYILWMAKLSGGARWGVIIGGYLGYRVLDSVADNNPEWAPFLWPLLWVYIAFAVMTWVSYPLFNLLLRFNRYGRHALSRDQRVASNWVAGCLAVVAASLAWWLLGGATLGQILALAGGLLIMPVAGTFQCSAGWPRATMGSFTLLLALAIPAGLALAAAHQEVSYFRNALNLFFVGILLAPWLANGLASVEVRR